MEQVFLRFPHLSENIFKLLDMTSSFCFMQVWKSSIEHGILYSPTVISAFTYDSASSLKNILQELTNDSLIQLACGFIEVYSEFPTGTKQTLELFCYTPLHKAAEKGLDLVYEFIVQDLVKHKAQSKYWSTIWYTNPKDSEGITPLHLAAKNGHVSLCKLIMERIKKYPGNYEFNRTPLHFAAEMGHYDVCQFLIYQIKDDKNPREADYLDTPLHVASENGHLKVCQLIIYHILKTGGNVNPMNEIHETPLYLAARNGHYEVCELIIDYVSDKNPKNPTSGDTPLHWAALNGHLSVCKLFIDNVGDKNPQNNIFTTPLHLAAEYGHLKICELFIQKIVDKSPLNGKFETPFYLAKKNGHVHVSKLLEKVWKIRKDSYEEL